MSTDVARTLAAKVAPALVAQIESRREQIIADSGNVLVRFAVRQAFPAGLRQIPTAVETGVDTLLDVFGSMTLGEIAERLVLHQRAKGRVPHASLYREINR